MNFFFYTKINKDNINFESLKNDEIILNIYLDDISYYSGDVFKAIFELKGPNKYIGNIKLDYIVIYLYGVYIFNKEVINVCDELIKKQDNINLPFYNENDLKEQRFLIFYTNSIILCSDIKFEKPNDTSYYILECILPSFIPPSYNGKNVKFKYYLYVHSVKRLYKNRKDFITKDYKACFPINILNSKYINSPFLNILSFPIKPFNLKMDNKKKSNYFFHNFHIKIKDVNSKCTSNIPKVIFNSTCIPSYIYNNTKKSNLENLLCIYNIYSLRKEDSYLYLLNYFVNNYNYFYFMHLFFYFIYHYNYYVNNIKTTELFKNIKFDSFLKILQNYNYVIKNKNPIKIKLNRQKISMKQIVNQPKHKKFSKFSSIERCITKNNHEICYSNDDMIITSKNKFHNALSIPNVKLKKTDFSNTNIIYNKDNYKSNYVNKNEENYNKENSLNKSINNKSINEDKDKNKRKNENNFNNPIDNFIFYDDNDLYDFYFCEYDNFVFNDIIYTPVKWYDNLVFDNSENSSYPQNYYMEDNKNNTTNINYESPSDFKSENKNSYSSEEETYDELNYNQSYNKKNKDKNSHNKFNEKQTIDNLNKEKEKKLTEIHLIDNKKTNFNKTKNNKVLENNFIKYDKDFEKINTIIKFMIDCDMFKYINTKKMKSTNLQDEPMDTSNNKKEEDKIFNNVCRNVYRINSGNMNICYITLTDANNNKIANTFTYNSIININIDFRNAEISTMHVDATLQRYEKVKLKKKLLNIAKKNLYDENSVLEEGYSSFNSDESSYNVVSSYKTIIQQSVCTLYCSEKNISIILNDEVIPTFRNDLIKIDYFIDIDFYCFNNDAFSLTPISLYKEFENIYNLKFRIPIYIVEKTHEIYENYSNFDDSVSEIKLDQHKFFLKNNYKFTYMDKKHFIKSVTM
ncbi:conserved Plasmodium protein, unknown function [Plasmodium gallinaceum]|uniref:Uncharacterized protein n=1 Tax=Plasmodium gallinaceum TaxID=5849 RepID=A0A1J1GLC9_PLAGA|nr:conserved Plasmodium protein, unknown function [Plasmodium gallinaceum]CRG93140.1 conserved Plasmodium protein, unknown function [Plasmodium gallinaceum]